MGVLGNQQCGTWDPEGNVEVVGLFKVVRMTPVLELAWDRAHWKYLV